MREISSALLTAQQGSKRIPYVELIFHKEDGSDSIDYSDRRVLIKQHEEHLNEYATIILRNDDHAVQDIKGWWVEMLLGDKFFTEGAYGAKTITGLEGHKIGRLWVKSQMDLSSTGIKNYSSKKMIVLELDDKKLEETPCLLPGYNMLAPYHYVKIDEGFTPSWMIGYCVQQINFGMEYSEEDDGFINSFIYAVFIINEKSYQTGKYESLKDVVERQLSYTKCYLRKKPSLTETASGMYKVVYPTDNDPINETYYSYQQPYFYEFVYTKNVVIPNKILSYCNYNYELETWDDLIVGVAEDQESIDAYGEVPFMFWAPEVTTQGEADFVAEAYLRRQKIASRGGRLIISLDHRVELFDRVKVFDAR